jgi:hypothetical protein
MRFEEEVLQALHFVALAKKCIGGLAGHAGPFTE